MMRYSLGVSQPYTQRLRPFFQVYQNDNGTLLDIKNVTISWRRWYVKNVITIMVSVPGLSVGLHDIIVRASDGSDNVHIDYNATVNVIPVDRIPHINLTKTPLPYDDFIFCSVTGDRMLPGIITFEHLVNDQSQKKVYKVLYNATQTIGAAFFGPPSEDQHSCIVKEWVRTRQKSPCGRSPWTVSTAIGNDPGTSSRTQRTLHRNAILYGTRHINDYCHHDRDQNGDHDAPSTLAKGGSDQPLGWTLGCTDNRLLFRSRHAFVDVEV